MGHHVARKRFGQHFLVDTTVIEAIADAADVRRDEPLIEIGPGLGALTEALLARGARLTVIELDRDLAARWRRDGRVTVIEADVLKVDFGELARAQATPLRLVGNLPYNISSPILFHLLPQAHQVADQLFMLQKEVVERMVAGPGTKDYGRLSVMLQWRYAMELVLDIGPEAFDPPPRVDSAVVRMRPLAAPAAIDAALLSALVACAFSQRRKLLRHTLGGWMAERGLEGGFDLQRRAEEVPVDEYLALAQRAA
ncbi:MAG: 16S rRNA (adenine(1518)-N(6)/adenine(1519)-N(6))-dimethyltransferase RsmA [Rubrivivax sp.]|nr:16S rRNA (adenine(1518)-N(6)/adenine(1519)-N(6))-dimethyltransferase RsmA [Rubrivivax sp.]